MIAEMAVANGASQKASELALLLELVKDLEPRVVVEIGSMDGGTMLAWRAVAPEAEVISISLPNGPYGGGNTATIAGDSHDINTLRQLRETLAGRKIDFLFIDGDHSYKGVAEDFLMYAQHVRQPGGLVAFHDILPHPGMPDVQVDRFWNSLKDTGMFPHTEFVSPDEHRDYGQWGGIGVLHL